MAVEINSKEVAVHPKDGCAQFLADLPLKLSYLAEGAANVIYAVQTDGTPDKQHDLCCVLRMRKDLPHIKPTRESLDDFQTRIRPLFSGHEDLLMQQVLYKLSPELVEECNRTLLDMESATPISHGKRSKKRQSVYHPSSIEEKFGILMPDMRAQQAGGMVEFKPKWLVQSPSAPPGATRCRTCATNAFRQDAGVPRGRGNSGFCPLDLLSDDPVILKRALSNIWLEPQTLEAFLEIFLLRVQPGIKHLRRLQLTHNRVGLDDFESSDNKDFSLAMALRDCSMFLKVKFDGMDGRTLILESAKFADLDLKSSDGGKLEKWAKMESNLIREGWYDGKDDIENSCALSR